MLIEIFPANRTQPLTFGFAKRFERKLEQGKLAHQRLQVNVGIFRNEQARFGYRFAIESKKLCKFPLEQLPIFAEAAHTLQCNRTAKIPLDNQTLRSAPDLGKAFKICQHQVLASLKARKFEFEITAITNRSIDNESDVQPQGFTRVSHLVHFNERLRKKANGLRTF